MKRLNASKARLFTVGMILLSLSLLSSRCLGGISIGEIYGPLSLDSAWPPQSEGGSCWSPDGTMIVFSWGDGYTAWDPSLGGYPNPEGSYIVTMTADGQAIRGPDNPLVNDPYWDNHSPDWSPDGNWIVYAGSRVGPAYIARVSLIDGTVVSIPGTIGGHPKQPKWSPDGTKIAYLGGGWGGSPSYHICITDPDGSSHEDLTPGVTGYGVTGLSWSQDGTRIVFTQESQPGLLVLDVATKAVTSLPGFPSGLTPSTPVWASQNSILFVAGGAIYCYQIGTQTTTQLTYGPGDSLGDWNPTTGLVFSSSRGCTVRWDSNIYTAIPGISLPPEEDIDNDGLLNGWEINGYDKNGDGIVDIDLPALGADPRHKDLFVEVDAMVGRAPNQTALNRVVDAFAAVPNSLVDNPDGMDGITLHIQLDETDIPLADWPNAFGDFDNVRNNRFGTPAQRTDTNWSNIRDAKAKVYRYCIFANTHSGGTSSGYGERPGNDFMVTLGAWSPPGGDEDQQVGTFMHEFGHNLNLDHGGNDDINYKPNYHSIMNYHWQTPHSNHTGWELDYSREVLPTLDESSLDENAGIGGAAGVTVPVGPLRLNGLPWIVSESGPVNWNHNGNWDTGVNADINYVRANVPADDGGPSPGQVLTGHNDWPVLWYRLSGHSNFQDGVHIDIPEEMTYEVYREIYGPRINATLDFDPDTLNLGSQGQFVTTYIELPGGFNVSDIVISSLMLNISVPALSTPIEIGDYDSDGITDLMVKFDRQEVIEILDPGEHLVYLTGRLSDGTSLSGDEIIWVFPKKQKK